MEFLIERLPLYLDGAWVTVQLTIGGCALAFVLAMVFGVLGSMKHWLPRAVATVYVEVFRGIAALVLMFWMAFALPLATGFELENRFAAIVALVVLPQAWAQMLPTFGNLVIELMKATAVAYLIGVADLTAVAQQMREGTGETIIAFIGAFILYYLIAQVLISGMRLLERRANRRLGRTPPGGTGLKGLLKHPSVTAGNAGVG